MVRDLIVGGLVFSVAVQVVKTAIVVEEGDIKVAMYVMVPVAENVLDAMVTGKQIRLVLSAKARVKLNVPVKNAMEMVW